MILILMPILSCVGFTYKETSPLQMQVHDEQNLFTHVTVNVYTTHAYSTVDFSLFVHQIILMFHSVHRWLNM